MNSCITFLVILFFVVTFLCIFKSYTVNKSIVEKFEEIQKNTMSKFDRFYHIIKAFEKAKNTKPSPNELHAYYEHFSEIKTYTSEEVVPMIKDNKQYEKILEKFLNKHDRISDVDKENNPTVQTKKSNDIRSSTSDEDRDVLVKKVYSKLFPSEKLTSDNIDFLSYKLQKFDNDTTKLEEYITTNDEYKTFIKKRLDNEKTTHLPNDDKDLNYKISRPSIGKTTVTITSTKNDTVSESLSCNDIEDEHVVAKLVNDRNLDKLRFACLGSKAKYSNLKDDMVLLPDQKWSVPQRQPDICRTSRMNEYNPSVEQSSLIGTLLESAKDTKVGSLISEFKFEEKN